MLPVVQRIEQVSGSTRHSAGEVVLFALIVGEVVQLDFTRVEELGELEIAPANRMPSRASSSR